MKKAILTPFIIATAFVATPAFGQTAYENCKTNDTQNQVLGAVIGGSLGAIIGNGISNDTGAVLGGLAGGTAGVAIADQDCSHLQGGPVNSSTYHSSNSAKYNAPYSRRQKGGTIVEQETISYDQYGNRIVTRTTSRTDPSYSRYDRRYPRHRRTHGGYYYP